MEQLSEKDNSVEGMMHKVLGTIVQLNALNGKYIQFFYYFYEAGQDKEVAESNPDDLASEDAKGRFDFNQLYFKEGI